MTQPDQPKLQLAEQSQSTAGKIAQKILDNGVLLIWIFWGGFLSASYHIRIELNTTAKLNYEQILVPESEM
jgi:hypothetical protein